MQEKLTQHSGKIAGVEVVRVVKTGSMSRQVALGGIISALRLAIMFLAGIVPTTTYVLPMAAGAMIMLIAVELGNKPALCAYISVSALSVILVPDRQVALMFALFFGFYPLAKQKLERLPSRSIEYTCKLLLFSITMAAVHLMLIFVFGMRGMLEGIGERIGISSLVLLALGGLAVGGVMFICYDILLTRCYTLYVRQYRQKLFGGAKWGS